jgi:hypothetical protein
MFEFLGIEVSLRDYQRMPDITIGKGKKPGIVKIELVRLDDRDAIFGSLAKKGREKEVKNITVTQDLPLSLQKDFKTLDKAAYQLRTKEKVRTRVVVKGLQLVLQKRGAVGEKWTDVQKI